MPPKEKTTALDDIFGGEDELSDIESEGDDAAPAPAGGSTDDDGSDDGAADDDDDDDDPSRDADYAQAVLNETAEGGVAAHEAAALPTFRKEGGGSKKRREPGQDGERPAKKAKKKQARRAQDEDEDGVAMREQIPMDPVQERAQRLEAILQNKKPKIKRRKKGEEDLDEMADEEVYRIRQLMDSAAEQDREAVQDGRPAIEKLKLLPEVVGVLQKTHLEQTILEADILTQIRRWLEPIGKAMPALNIQRALLDALTKMEIETSALKASELGKVVLFYTKHPKLDSAIKRGADQLIMNWMRPIIRRSAAARDRTVRRVEAASLPANPGALRRARAKQAAAAAGSQGNSTGRMPLPRETDQGRRHAAIPQANNTAYTVAPISRVMLADAQGKSTRFKGMKAKIDTARQDSRRM